MNFIQHDGCDVGEQETKKHMNTARNFVGPLANALTFNNGFHTMHHLKPHLHWSLLPEAHAKEVAPTIDPRLDEQCMLRYFLHNFILPGRRVTFRGDPIVFDGPEPEDEGWITMPEGLTEEDIKPTVSNFLQSIKLALPTIMLIPFKVMSPTYSPIHKID